MSSSHSPKSLKKKQFQHKFKKYYLFKYKARKKNFGSGQLIFENWSGGPVDLFSFFLNHNINIPNLIFQKVLKTCIDMSVKSKR